MYYIIFFITIAKYIGTANTLSNIKQLSIFGKKLLLRCLTGFWIHLQNFIILGKKLVFRKWSSSKVYIPRKSSEENKMDNRFIDIILKYRVRNTAWKVSVFGVFLVRIFPNLDWMRRNTEYSIRMRENKNQKSSEYGPFSRSAMLI